MSLRIIHFSFFGYLLGARVVAPDWLVGETQQVEQSSGETNSVNGMKLEMEQVHEETGETDSVKGKELTTKRGKKPPLNFLAILFDANITLDTSSPDKLCDELYAGVFLKKNTLASSISISPHKYFVDKKLNKNCFEMFARELYICWAEDPQYWQWTKEKDTRGEDIEVAKLVDVCWLEIQGTFRTIDLSLGTVYEVVFIVKMLKHNSWFGEENNSVTLTIILPRSKSLTRNEKLNKKPCEEWIEIQVGEFIISPENVGDITFKLDDRSSRWKTGLVLKCAIIRPKNY
ncbi:protein phloem protein 2-like a1 [Fagus crenata]